MFKTLGSFKKKKKKLEIAIHRSIQVERSDQFFAILTDFYDKLNTSSESNQKLDLFMIQLVKLADSA